ncbi:MAG: thioredoxin [Planctomycetaceae bacterium]|nr:thioredoxin [Planctomycetaceae bacterium]
MSELTEIQSEEEFTDATKGGVALVDFFAPWCGPCRIQLPILQKLAAELGEKVKILKVNVDNLPRLALKFDVSNIPTLILLKDGNLANRFVGVQQETTLKNAING